MNELFEQVVPPVHAQSDWPDVLRRSRRSRRRRLIAAGVVAVCLLGATAAIAAALGGFDAWLRGTPGRPAPAPAQDAFSAAHHSWLGFPATTKLRELIRTQSHGQTYQLDGFRSGGSLCLRLDAIDLKRSTGPACAPVSTVTHASSPIIVVVSQAGLADRGSRPVATVGYGIASDDVASVTARTTETTYPARVDGNAFLWIENQPVTGERLLTLTARLKDGRRVVIVPRSFSPTNASLSPPLHAHGPSRVEAMIPHPHISHTGPTKPDPLGNLAVKTDGASLTLIIDSRPGGESTMGRLFTRGPIEVMIAGRGTDQFLTVAGLAADGVTRVSVYLADRERVDASLRRNAFSAEIPLVNGPIRVVAFDRRNRVVGIQTTPTLIYGRPAPHAALRHFKQLLRLTGPEGSVARLRAGPTAEGTRCWNATFSHSVLTTACQPPSWPPPGWRSVHSDGHDVFVFGRVRAPKARVEISFDDGDKITAQKRDSFFLAAIPATHLSRRQQHAFVVTILRNADGSERRTSHQSIYYKQLPS